MKIKFLLEQVRNKNKRTKAIGTRTIGHGRTLHEVAPYYKGEKNGDKNDSKNVCCDNCLCPVCRSIKGIC